MLCLTCPATVSFSGTQAGWGGSPQVGRGLVRGLRADRWYVIGFDLYYDSDESHDTIVLYAVDRDAAVGARNYDELAAYAAVQGMRRGCISVA